MDFIAELKELALASRLRRLSDALMKDAATVYRDMGFDFQPRWFALFAALGRRSPMAITEAARLLGLTHPAVSQIARQLQQAGLVRESPDRRDARRRLLRISPRGRRWLVELEPIWRETRGAAGELQRESDVDLIGDLERIESALARRSMVERVRGRLALPDHRRLRIEDYRPAYKKHFRALNEEWLRRHFAIERHDARILSDPNRQIIRKKGHILFALLGDEVVGTCALQCHPGPVYELTKMSVAPSVRGQGIGRTLLGAVLDRARQVGAKEIYLQTSPELAPAIRLYRRAGFRRARRNPLPPCPYGRCSLTMRLTLPD